MDYARFDCCELIVLGFPCVDGWEIEMSQCAWFDGMTGCGVMEVEMGIHG